jgi:hypothetical protein
MVGYSGTPLPKKLGIKEGARIFLDGAPENYVQLLGPLPPGVKLIPRIDSQTDFIHIFASERLRLVEALRHVMTAMKPDAAIWVSWPKKTSRMQTDITEDTVRDVALPMGLVDIKVCAVDEIWSGLKLVLRKANRPATPARLKKPDRPPEDHAAPR